MNRNVPETIISGTIAMLMIPPAVVAFRKAADVISNSLYLSDMVTQTPMLTPLAKMLGTALILAGILLIILSIVIKKPSEALMGLIWTATGTVVFLTPERVSGLDDTLTQTTPYLKITLLLGIILWLLWTLMSVREEDNLLFVLRMMSASVLVGISIIPATAIAILVSSLLTAMLGMIYAIIFSEGLGALILDDAELTPEGIGVARIGAMVMLTASVFTIFATLWDAYIFISGAKLPPLYLISIYALAVAVGLMALGVGMMFGARGTAVGGLSLITMLAAVGASFWDRMVAIMLIMIGTILANTISIKIHQEILRLKIPLGKLFHSSESLYWLTMLVLIFTIGSQNPIVEKVGQSITYTLPITTLIGSTIMRLLIFGAIASLVWSISEELKILSYEIGGAA